MNKADLNPLEALISEAQAELVHGYANFGHMTARAVINEGVIKCAIGFSCGHTQWQILREHRLITTRGILTKKGFAYSRALYTAGQFNALN